MNNELYHYGVPGMKWGRRRYQNKDGSLTKAGMRRAEKFEQKTNKEVNRIADKNITFKHKSKHRLKLEEQYKQQGLTNEQAQAAANNRIRTEKALATIAAATATAAVSYYAYKRHKRRADQIIKAGDALQRMEFKDTKGKLHDTFYMSKGKHDNERYEGQFGAYIQRQNNGVAYKLKLRANQDVKIASRDNAAKTFGDLYKRDKDFREAVIEDTKSVVERYRGHVITNPNDFSKRNLRKIYENFNINLENARNNKRRPDKKFFSELSKKGYGAIQDINDMETFRKYYSVRNPLIVFDNNIYKQKIGGKKVIGKKIVVESMEKITQNVKDLTKLEVTQDRTVYMENLVENALKSLGPLSAGLTTAAIASTVSTPKSYETTKKRSTK